MPLARRACAREQITDERIAVSGQMPAPVGFSLWASKGSSRFNARYVKFVPGLDHGKRWPTDKHRDEIRGRELISRSAEPLRSSRARTNRVGNDAKANVFDLEGATAK